MTEFYEPETLVERLKGNYSSGGFDRSFAEFIPAIALEAAKRIEQLERDASDEIDYNYPRDLFLQLISQNSPYAFYIFQWVPYQTDAKRNRLKMCHDVKAFDGREEHGMAKRLSLRFN